MANTRLPYGRSERITDETVNFIKAAPNLINENEDVTTSGSATTANLTVYKTSITSGGTQGNENYNVGNGSGAVIGQRKLVQLITRTHASDAIVLDHANIVAADGTTAATGVVLNAANEFVLLEWNGAKWRAVYSTSGVVTTA